MKTINKECLCCKKQFAASLKEHNRGNAKFCSKTCVYEARRKKVITRKPNVVCAHCGTKFYKSESKKKTSKSGLFFCTRSCKDEAQRFGGIREIMPSHYGRNYRTICFAHHKKECIVCGEDKIVTVHHYDEDHSNNDPSNLIPLCPTHHQYVHSSYRHLVQEEIENWRTKNLTSAS